jgi:hypothetical protein
MRAATAAAATAFAAIVALSALAAVAPAAVAPAAGEGTPDDASVVPLRDGDSAASAGVCLGTDKGVGTVTVSLDDGKKHVFRMRVEPDQVRVKVTEGGKAVWKEQTLPDAAIDFAGLARRWCRPRLARYTAKQQEDLISRWPSLPPASRRFVTFEARQDEAGVAFYLDGQYVGRRDSKARLRGLAFALPAEGQVRDGRSFAYKSDPKYLPLDVKFIAKPGVMKAAAVTPESGPRTIQGVPLLLAGGADSVDVGVVKEMKGSWALECDEHLARTALDAMPETAHFSVPQAFYTRAWVLCAVDADPKREAILTARLTRFARSGRGEAIADTTIELPRGDAPPPAGGTKVGSVRYQDAGRDVETPLLLVELPLKLGEILDLLAMDKDPDASMSAQPYLDFEFLGKLDGMDAQWDRRHKPDNKSTSAVHVFGVTLEASPVALRLDAGQPGNIFHNDEKPEMQATLTATGGGKCGANLAWRIHDLDGATVRQDRIDLRLKAAEEPRRVTIPLATPELGWYGIDLAIRDEAGRELLRHAASFARLGRDTRRAGYDSPYGTWWFAGAHYGAADKEIAGPMLFKAGLRKTTFGWCKYTEQDMAPWKITLNQLGWSLAPQDMSDPQKAYDEAEKKVREQLERFPHCRSADIFHESVAHYVPEELYGQKPSQDAKAAEEVRRLAERGAFAARFYRERFPDIKLLVGNTSSSASIIAMLLRGGLDAKYIDFLGIEAVGQTGMPELLWEGSTQGTWLTRQVARQFGHDLPVTGCFEFTARADRNLGPRRQAEWIVRDMLLCHAYRFQHINPALLHDAGNAYVNSLWGAGGLCRRYPLLYPKPAYVGVATLTKVLDQITPVRRVPTGSATVYALEFRRADGQFAYALWTACGQADLRLRLTQGADVTRVGFLGQEKQVSAGPLGNCLDVPCDTAPVYVLSPVAAGGIEVTARRFPAPPPSFRVADKMDTPDRWVLAPGDDRLRKPTSEGLPIRVPGEFALAAVEDAERGRCLELTLRRNGQVPDIVGEYTALRLTEPQAVAGRPPGVGLWVKGDSGWGKIIFEAQDAVGAVWRTDGVWHDWPGDLAICHDGWRFMDFPIDGSSHVRNISPGARWTSTSAGRKGGIQFPIKLTGLHVVVYRKALDLTDMKEVPGVLRLSGLGTSSQDPAAGNSPPAPPWSAEPNSKSEMDSSTSNTSPTPSTPTAGT